MFLAQCEWLFSSSPHTRLGFCHLWLSMQRCKWKLLGGEVKPAGHCPAAAPAGCEPAIQGTCMFHCPWLSWSHTHLPPCAPALPPKYPNHLRSIFSPTANISLPDLLNSYSLTSSKVLATLKQKNSHVPLMWIWYKQSWTQTHCLFITLLSMWLLPSCLSACPVPCPVLVLSGLIIARLPSAAGRKAFDQQTEFDICVSHRYTAGYQFVYGPIAGRDRESISIQIVLVSPAYWFWSKSQETLCPVSPTRLRTKSNMSSRHVSIDTIRNPVISGHLNHQCIVLDPWYQQHWCPASNPSAVASIYYHQTPLLLSLA